MHIVMFSINPLFPNTVMGGAPKHLQNIAIYMGELGHNVTILCTRPDETAQPFYWQERVHVLPILPFKQPFPQPYAVPAYDMAAILQQVGDFLQKADRFYMHDGEFLFPYAYQDIPTVISLRDNVYPETLLGGFLFQGSKLILISNHSRRYFESTVGRFFPGLKDRIEVIHNGLDWQKFKPTTPEKILDIIPLDPDAQPIVLHPHRPEESKGIQQTIAVVDLLVHKYGHQNLKALAPKWLDLQATPELNEFYHSIETDIQQRGLQQNFIFHGWIPQELMPEYYSMGSVTFSLGHFVESFGNAVYESMGCGTPTIAARIATHRELMPDHLIDKVDFGDIEGAAARAHQIITRKRRTSSEAMAYLHGHFSTDRQLQAYAEAILKAEKAEPLQYQHPAMTENTRYRLAPWCYHAGGRGVYHDFHANYRQMENFLPLFEQYPNGFTLAEAAQYYVSEADVMTQYREGFLVPLT